MNRPATINVLMCCALCSIALFAYSHRFVNEEVTPKWIGLAMAVGIAGVCRTVLSGSKSVKTAQYANGQIPSRTITAIKNEMRQLIEAHEKATGLDNDNASEASREKTPKPTVQSSGTDGGEAANSRLGVNWNLAGAVSATQKENMQKVSVSGLAIASIAVDNRTSNLKNMTRLGIMSKVSATDDAARPP